jgi:hypothetical protein
VQDSAFHRRLGGPEVSFFVSFAICITIVFAAVCRYIAGGHDKRFALVAQVLRKGATKEAADKK